MNTRELRLCGSIYNTATPKRTFEQIEYKLAGNTLVLKRNANNGMITATLNNAKGFMACKVFSNMSDFRSVTNV